MTQSNEVQAHGKLWERSLYVTYLVLMLKTTNK